MLISIDGLAGSELVPAAKRLLSSKHPDNAGFSSWDASGIFFELHGLAVEEKPSARTLLLLYAADLRFRLRWQILPALQAGQIVVAAPYVETAIVFGLVRGLPRKWVKELFRFAPSAGEAFWIDVAPTRKAKPTSGFIEFCSDTLPPDFPRKFGKHFGALERRGKCRAFR